LFRGRGGGRKGRAGKGGGSWGREREGREGNGGGSWWKRGIVPYDYIY